MEVCSVSLQPPMPAIGKQLRPPRRAILCQIFTTNQNTTLSLPLPSLPGILTENTKSLVRKITHIYLCLHQTGQKEIFAAVKLSSPANQAARSSFCMPTNVPVLLAFFTAHTTCHWTSSGCFPKSQRSRGSKEKSPFVRVRLISFLSGASMSSNSL